MREEGGRGGRGREGETEEETGRQGERGESVRASVRVREEIDDREGDKAADQLYVRDSERRHLKCERLGETASGETASEIFAASRFTHSTSTAR